MLQELAPDLFTASLPLRFLGLAFGVRTTILRLPDSSLWVHSPIPLSPELRAAVETLGPVRHLVAPNLLHHRWIADWATAFPEARVFGSAALARKRKDLTFHGVLSDTPDPDWGGALVPVSMAGMDRQQETQFLHPASETLISADLVLALPPDLDHWWTNTYARLNGAHGKAAACTFVHKTVVTDRKTARASLDRLLDAPFSRLVVSHREVLVGSSVPDALREAWSWLR